MSKWSGLPGSPCPRSYGGGLFFLSMGTHSLSTDKRAWESLVWDVCISELDHVEDIRRALFRTILSSRLLSREIIIILPLSAFMIYFDFRTITLAFANILPPYNSGPVLHSVMFWHLANLAVFHTQVKSMPPWSPLFFFLRDCYAHTIGRLFACSHAFTANVRALFFAIGFETQ